MAGRPLDHAASRVLWARQPVWGWGSVAENLVKVESHVFWAIKVLNFNDKELRLTLFDSVKVVGHPELYRDINNKIVICAWNRRHTILFRLFHVRSLFLLSKHSNCNCTECAKGKTAYEEVNTTEQTHEMSSLFCLLNNHSGITILFLSCPSVFPVPLRLLLPLANSP